MKEIVAFVAICLFFLAFTVFVIVGIRLLAIISNFMNQWGDVDSVYNEIH